jgi:hypothetical protein
MIIVKLQGGIGNQMFQYAIGRRLSLERGVQLKLDLSWFHNQTKRSYRLSQFNIQAETRNSFEMEKLYRKDKNILYSKVIRQMERFLPYYQRRVIFERKSGFDPNILKAQKFVYLDGYWQSQKYFSGYEMVLKNDLKLKEPIRDQLLIDLENKFQNENSVSLHIRRGDYIQDLKSAAYHGICSTSYYHQATNYLAECESDLRVYVFSDDIEWAKHNLSLKLPTEFISGRFDIPDFIELELMKNCKHHIIANSSFSWWAAWLAKSPEKIVISPIKWFVNKEVKNLIPAEWISL